MGETDAHSTLPPAFGWEGLSLRQPADLDASGGHRPELGQLPPHLAMLAMRFPQEGEKAANPTGQCCKTKGCISRREVIATICTGGCGNVDLLWTFVGCACSNTLFVGGCSGRGGGGTLPSARVCLAPLQHNSTHCRRTVVIPQRDLKGGVGGWDFSIIPCVEL